MAHRKSLAGLPSRVTALPYTKIEQRVSNYTPEDFDYIIRYWISIIILNIKYWRHRSDWPRGLLLGDSLCVSFCHLLSPPVFWHTLYRYLFRSPIRIAWQGLEPSDEDSYFWTINALDCSSVIAHLVTYFVFSSAWLSIQSWFNKKVTEAMYLLTR